MSIRFVLVILAYLSPIFRGPLAVTTGRALTPACALLVFANAALVDEVTAVLGFISFVLTLLGGMTSECTQAWQCALALEFDASRGLFLCCALRWWLELLARSALSTNSDASAVVRSAVEAAGF